ncbi:hypothetical protein HG531_010308 [Fusarium graminearum]|nr:hypothetical protein HG531_010308 [Fusarium graminearum]
MIGKTWEACLPVGIQDVTAGQDLRSKSLRLAEKLAGSDELLSDLGGQSQGLGSNKLDLDLVVSEQVHKRVHRSAVEKVTKEGDGQALDGTQLLTDGEEIEEGLGGVLLAAVATVDDRDRAVLLGNVDARLLGVAEDNSITVASQSAEGVLESLTLLDGRVRGGDGDGAATKTLHSSIERRRGASRRLVEERGQQATSEDVQDTLTLNTKTHLLCNSEEQMEISSAVGLDGQNDLTVEADGGVLESDSLNRAAHDTALKRRPEVARSQVVRAVNLGLNGSSRLLVELKDLHGVGVETVLDVIDSKATLSNRGQEKRQSIVDTHVRITLVAERSGQAVRETANGEDIDGGQVRPKSLLVNSGRKTLALGTLSLAESDQLDIVLVGNRSDVDATVVKAGEQKNGGQIGQLGISDNWLVVRPRVEVSSDSSDLADVAREVVERNEERSNLASNMADLSEGISDGTIDTQRHNSDHAETGRDGRLGNGLNVVAVGRSNTRNESSDVDKTRQNNGSVAGLVIALGNLQLKVAGNGLDEDLGVLDVGDKRNLVINSHTTSLVSLTHVVGRTAVLVVGRQVDVQIDGVLCQMLGERELGATVLLLAKNLKVLALNAMLLEEIGGTGSSKQLVTKLLKLLHRRKHLTLVLVGLVLVNTETSNLTSRGHLNTQNRISARKTGETELRHLNTNTVGGKISRRVSLERLAHDSLGSHLNQINTHNLGHEGERTRSTNVTLNNLDVVVLGNELNVERTSDVESGTNLASGLLNTLDSGSLQILRRQDKGSITRVNTSVLNVLRDEVTNNLTVLSNSVHLNLLSVLNVLGNNDRVVSRNLNSLVQVVLQILLRVNRVHSSTRKNIRRSNQNRVRNRVTEVLSLTEAYTGAEDHDTVVVEADVMLGGVVGHVEVVCEGRELCGDGIDLLDEGLDAGLETQATDGNLVGAPELGELTIAEAETLGLEEDGGAGGDVGGAVAGHALGEVAETLELGEEPLVDLGKLPDLVDGVSFVHGVGNGKQTLVRGGLELVLNAHEGLGVVEAQIVGVDGTDRLLDGFLE